MVLLLVLRHVVLSPAVLAGGGDKEGFTACGDSEATRLLVWRAVVVARPALGSKVQVWRAVMGYYTRAEHHDKTYRKCWT